MIAAQKELAAKVGKKKREITLKIVPDEILAEAKALAGDRFVPALLTPGKLNREAACNAIKNEVGEKLVAKYGAEKVTPFVINDAFYYIQKEAVRKLILESGKRLDGRNFEAVRPITSEVGILPARPRFGDFSRAAKRRPSRSPRSAPATTRRNLIPTPAARTRRNSSCITTSRISPSAKPAASAVPAAAKSATARSPNARLNP